MLEHLRGLAVFARTVEAGSFRGAARSLGLSPSVISHHVAQLEASLGVVLLNRSTRKLGLTGEGARLLESAKANTLKVQELMTFWGMGGALHKGGMVSPGLWLRRESLAVLAGNRPDVIHADLAACNAYKDALARAAAVNCPTVLVLADGDLMTPAAKARPLAAAITGAKSVVVPNCGHFMMVERPDETLAALKSHV